MIWSRRVTALCQGFQGDGDVRGCAAAAPAGTKAARSNRARDGAHRRVCLDNGRHFLQFSFHQLKRTRRIAADTPLKLAGILLRKKSPWEWRCISTR